MPKGWTIFAGGKGGTMPRLGNRLIMNVPDDKVLEMVDKIVKVYAENASGKERLGAYIDRIGLDEFKSILNLDSFLQ